MTPEQAAWVREQVWPVALAAGLGPTEVCACQFGESTWCLNGDCSRCEDRNPIPYPDTYITDKAARVLAWSETLFTHPTARGTGATRSRDAMVWLADRVCRWRCPCGCHHQTIAARPTVVEQLDLFAEVA